MTDRELGRLIDEHTERLLADVGLRGFSLAASVDSDGHVDLWLVDRDRLGVEGTDHGTAEPPHELPGPLPPPWASRVAHAPLRCGAATAHGHHCRVRVDRPGTRCHHHGPTTTEEHS